MSISSISSGASAITQLYASQTTDSTASSSQSQRPQGPPPPPPGGGPISTAAEVLGMEEEDVTEALANGASLADLAEEQGVSLEDLTAALAADAPEDMQESENFDALIDDLVNRTGLGGPGGMMPPPDSTGALGESLTSAQEDALSTIAEALEMDTATLVSQLKSGVSLADLLLSSQDSTLASGTDDGVLISVDL